MALIDPADQLSPPARNVSEEAPTRHPLISVILGFGFIVLSAFSVHLLFRALT